MVGYDQDRQTVYGKDHGGHVAYADPMTIAQARRYLKTLEGSASKAIYKLVPVRDKRV